MANVSDTTTDVEEYVSDPATVPADGETGAERTFSISIAISAVRCTFTYVLIPWVFPFLGETTGIGPALGAVVGVAAIIANIFSIRRFHRADHRWKWHMTFINLSVIALLVFLVGTDITDLIN